MAFSYTKLFEALDQKRQTEDNSFRDLAGFVGTCPATFTRIKQGHSVRTDTLAKLLSYLGKTFEDFSSSRRQKRA